MASAKKNLEGLFQIWKVGNLPIIFYLQGFGKCKGWLLQQDLISWYMGIDHITACAWIHPYHCFPIPLSCLLITLFLPVICNIVLQTIYSIKRLSTGNFSTALVAICLHCLLLLNLFCSNFVIGGIPHSFLERNWLLSKGLHILQDWIIFSYFYPILQ